MLKEAAVSEDIGCGASGIEYGSLTDCSERFTGGAESPAPAQAARSVVAMITHSMIAILFFIFLSSVKY